MDCVVFMNFLTYYYKKNYDCFVYEDKYMMDGSSRNKYNEKCGDNDDGSSSSNICVKVRIHHLSTCVKKIDCQIFSRVRR